MRRRLAVTIALVAAACAPDVAIETPLVPASQRVYEGSATAAVPLADGRVLIDADDGLFVVGDPGTAPERIGDAGELGAIVAWTAIDGATLIAGESAVVLVRGTSLVTAPIAEVLDEGETVHAFAATPRSGHVSDLWISTTEGLYLFRDEALSPITVEGHDLASAELAPSAEEEIWATAAGRLLRITMIEGVIAATLFERPIDVVSIASDDRGVPWMIAAMGLHVLEDDGRLFRFQIPGRPSSVRASGSGPDAWVSTDDGTWHVSRRSARPVTGMPATDAPAAPGVDGEIFALGDGGVDRFRARHRVVLEGVHEGARLVERTDVQVLSDAVDAATISASIDRMPIDIDGATIVLDPASIAFGAHRLDVTVRYTDGTLPTALSLGFTIAPSVTWTDQVRGIYVESCSDCHGPAGPSPTRLDSREAFRANIVRILENTRAGRMPLGRTPLSPEVIGLIQTWSDSGFPE